MTWSPSRIAAIEPTIDASAPSARWVWPRITPGCSSNVRLTRSSNSRMRSIWVKTQTSRSRSRPLPLPLAVAGQTAVVDRLIDEVVHVLALPVAELDPAQVLRRDALEVLGRDPELLH